MDMLEKVDVERNVYDLILILGEGAHKCGFMKGWITIEGMAGEMADIMWTTGEDDHNTLSGPAYAATFCKEYATGICESAYSMWPVRTEEGRVDTVNILIKKLKQAHRKASKY